MTTKLDIDPKLIDQALTVSGERTKRAAVTRALQAFIARPHRQGVLELLGQLEWDDTFDYESARSRRTACSSTPVPDAGAAPR